MTFIKIIGYEMAKLQKKKIEDIVFQVKIQTGAVVKTTRGYWEIITNIKHPSISGKEKNVKQTLTDPHEIRISKKDKSVYLFYRKYRDKFLCVVTRLSKKEGYIITVYYTKKIKEGDLKWKK